MKEYIINSPKYGVHKVLLDDEDYERIMSSNIKLRLRKDKSNIFYVIFSTPMVNKVRSTIQLHRWIMNCPKHLQVDHINHNTLDNRKENLRCCSMFENNKNRKSNTSGYAGVYFYKPTNKWRAFITCKRKQISLGCFNTLDEAIKVRQEAEQKYFN